MIIVKNIWIENRKKKSDNCLESIPKNENGKKKSNDNHIHNIKIIDQILSEKEKEKMAFLISFEYFIKKLYQNVTIY